MTQVIEDAVKALTEFEAELDRIKAEAAEAKKRLVKSAVEWADAAKSSAVSKAQNVAEQRVNAARAEATAEADSIRSSGETSLAAFRDTMSKRKDEAVVLATKRLLGEKS